MADLDLDDCRQTVLLQDIPFSRLDKPGEYFSRSQSRAFASGAAISRSVLLIFVVFVHFEA